MKLQTALAALVAAFVVVGVPIALAAKPPAPGHSGSPAASQYKPGGHAYGFFCQGESKTHVAGTPGTPFSKCVTAMAKLASGATTSPKAACASESKKHVAGKTGTAFSLCVAGGAKLLKTTP
jgi:hypothetical protein